MGLQKAKANELAGSFSARLAFFSPAFSPSLSPKPSSCLISPLLSGFLRFTSPLFSLLALSGPHACLPLHSSPLPLWLSQSLSQPSSEILHV